MVHVYIYRTITSKLPSFRDGNDIERLTPVGVQLHVMVLLIFSFFRCGMYFNMVLIEKKNLENLEKKAEY